MSPVLNEVVDQSRKRSRQPLLPITLKINGEKVRPEVSPWVTLLDLLRERLDLIGTKKGCDHGRCGACTVLVGGKRINSCLTLAVMQDGAEIRTIEGLSRSGESDLLQQAFIPREAASVS